MRPVDLVIDTVGGETRERSSGVLKSGGVLVFVVSADPMSERADVRSLFFYAEVSTERLNRHFEAVFQRTADPAHRHPPAIERMCAPLMRCSPAHRISGQKSFSK